MRSSKPFPAPRSKRKNRFQPGVTHTTAKFKWRAPFGTWDSRKSPPLPCCAGRQQLLAPGCSQAESREMPGSRLGLGRHYGRNLHRPLIFRSLRRWRRDSKDEDQHPTKSRDMRCAFKILQDLRLTLIMRKVRNPGRVRLRTGSSGAQRATISQEPIFAPAEQIPWRA